VAAPIVVRPAEATSPPVCAYAAVARDYVPIGKWEPDYTVVQWIEPRIDRLWFVDGISWS
jgi:hypothetical protein